jgi:hypothetical protein
MKRRSWGWLRRAKTPAVRAAAPVTMLLLMQTLSFTPVGSWRSDDPPLESAPQEAMLILRGIASAARPRGQLDDKSALEYAYRLGYQGEVLDVAGNTGGNNPQVRMALDRIHRASDITAIYGFSGGGYNARKIWSQLTADERRRIRKIVVIGSPGVDEDDFPGAADVTIKRDPPAGHMAGPKVLLESLDRS